MRRTALRRSTPLRAQRWGIRGAEDMRERAAKVAEAIRDSASQLADQSSADKREYERQCVRMVTAENAMKIILSLPVTP